MLSRIVYAGYHMREGLCVVGWWDSDVELSVVYVKVVANVVLL